MQSPATAAESNATTSDDAATVDESDDAANAESDKDF